MSSLPRERLRGYVLAIFKDAVIDLSSPWWNGEIWVCFFFDGEGKLLTHVVKPFGYLGTL